MNKLNRTSIESFVLGIIAVVSGIFLFLLIPGKPYGFNIIQPVDAIEEFNKFTFLLFFILLLSVITLGSSIVAIVFGIKDFRGIFRGAYITRGRIIYLIGTALGILGIISFIFFVTSLFFL
jgi:quinol-cytochrome oxidoreductase complex cytochrome b subunit